MEVDRVSCGLYHKKLLIYIYNFVHYVEMGGGTTAGANATDREQVRSAGGPGPGGDPIDPPCPATYTQAR